MNDLEREIYNGPFGRFAIGTNESRFAGWLLVYNHGTWVSVADLGIASLESQLAAERYAHKRLLEQHTGGPLAAALIVDKLRAQLAERDAQIERLKIELRMTRHCPLCGKPGAHEEVGEICPGMQGVSAGPNTPQLPVAQQEPPESQG
jgi:hypothetical protein